METKNSFKKAIHSLFFFFWKAYITCVFLSLDIVNMGWFDFTTILHNNPYAMEIPSQLILVEIIIVHLHSGTIPKHFDNLYQLPSLFHVDTLHLASFLIPQASWI